MIVAKGFNESRSDPASVSLHADAFPKGMNPIPYCYG